MNAMPLAFLQNMGLLDWIILISLLYILYSRVGMRKAGRSEGSAFNESPPPASAPSSSALSDCYRTLEIPESANLDQIREAYKNLVKVWHPDRFQHDPKLREKAEQKLKEINTAYDKLIKAKS
jgi:DnaJ-domain-containing protein 1